MVQKLNEISITTALKLLDKKEISAHDITKACIEEIEKRNVDVNAYLETFDDA